MTRTVPASLAYPPMKLAVIIPAAGASRRFGGRSKIDEDLGGRPVLQRTVELFANRAEVAVIIVAGPASGWEEFRLRHADRLGLLGIQICKGGVDHRYESVRNALTHLWEAESCAPFRDCTHIAVHDGARPATPQDLIDRVVSAAGKHGAVIPGVDVPDTIKRVGPATEDREIDPLDAILGGAGKPGTSLRPVVKTEPRDNLMLVQTPQVFRADLLKRAYAQKDLESTDDAQLVERLGEPVHVVEGDARNIKITRPFDVELCRRILNLRGPVERETHKKF